jgi:hypothetical protein
MNSHKSGTPRLNIVGAVTAWLVVLAFSAPAEAAQIIAMDMKAKGGVPARLAEALNPVLVAELARREGMSVVSQNDVRALLELESDKAMAGCTDTSCMADIAGSLGAELMATTTISKVGAEYVVSMTLIQSEGAKIVRRSTGRARGGDEAANEALLNSIHELFRGELPGELMGPASMSRRGFEAALAGLKQAVLSKALDAKPQRKRVILDLVNTELDYDAEPKMGMLDLAIRRGRGEAQRRLLGSRNKKEQQHYLGAIAEYNAMGDDLGRVKEIRTRARERGVVPSARPLRFMEPDPVKLPDQKELNRYWKRANAARTVVKKALAAYGRDDVKAFQKLWKKGYEGNAKRELESGRKYDKKNGYSYDIMPLHAMTPSVQRYAVGTLESPEKRNVYLRKFKKGEIYSSETVYLIEEDGRWVISSW